MNMPTFHQRINYRSRLCNSGLIHDGYVNSIYILNASYSVNSSIAIPIIGERPSFVCISSCGAYLGKRHSSYPKTK